jgi:hypothetical protein
LAVSGWLLVHQRLSPATLHLLEWIEALMEGSFEVTVLLPPGEPADLPGDARSHEVSIGSGDWGRMLFEQRGLPAAATRLGCDALLLIGDTAPVSSNVPVIALADLSLEARRGGALERLRRALGRAGSRGAAATLIYEDLPPAQISPPPQRPFPPFMSRGFSEQLDVAMTSYVLCHGIHLADIPVAIAAWTWVEGSLGDTYPLLFAGCDPELEQQIRRSAKTLGISDSVEFKPEISLQDLPALYRQAAAFLAVSFTAWGQPLRWSLAAEVPVAGVRSAQSSSILREAGYLIPSGDARALGAACLSLLVQEDLSGELRKRGRQIARGFAGAETREHVAGIVQELLEVNRE